MDNNATALPLKESPPLRGGMAGQFAKEGQTRGDMPLLLERKEPPCSPNGQSRRLNARRVGLWGGLNRPALQFESGCCSRPFQGMASHFAGGVCYR